SDAERQTLLHLLGASASARWRRKIVRSGDGLFFRRWPHLDSVYAVDDTLHVRIAATPVFGSFPVTVEAREITSRRCWTWRGQSESPHLALRLPGAREAEVTIRIFDCVAFRGVLGFGDDLPF